MRDQRTTRAVCGIILALACAGTCHITAAEAPAAATCDADGALHFVCGPANAEDLVRVGQTRWLIASGMDGVLVGPQAARGHLYLIDHQARKWQEAFPGPSPAFRHDKTLYGSCPGPLVTTNFSAHGLALRERAPGRYRLYVTGHGAREAIEVFEVDATGATPAITWTGCVPLPEDVSANSVAILPDWGFVTTKFLDRRLSQQESFAQVRQGKVNGAIFEWHPGSPVRMIAGTELSAPNGIEVSPDGATLYVAVFGTRELVRFRRDGARLQKDSVSLDITPDNVRWSANGKLLTAGSNVAAAGAAPTRAWSVVEVDPATLAARRIAGTERSPGMQAISVGLEVDGVIWVGTFSGDRVGYVQR
jgi:hypothetical protein